jgi:hypothetical protein
MKSPYYVYICMYVNVCKYETTVLIVCRYETTVLIVCNYETTVLIVHNYIILKRKKKQFSLIIYTTIIFGVILEL